MHQLTTSTSSSSTATLPTTGRMTAEAAAALVDSLHARLEPIEGHPTRCSVPSSRAPTTLERRQLCAVVERLERDLAELGAADEREYAIGRFLLGYEKGKGSELNAGLLNEEFLEAVEDQPLVGILEACKRFRQGKTLLPVDRGWRPSPDQFAAEVREGLVPLRARLVKARRILEAEVYTPPTPEQSAEVARLAQELAESLKMKDGGTPPLAMPEERERSGFDLVAPLRGLDASHLMARLDAGRARA